MTGLSSPHPSKSRRLITGVGLYTSLPQLGLLNDIELLGEQFFQLGNATLAQRTIVTCHDIGGNTPRKLSSMPLRRN